MNVSDLRKAIEGVPDDMEVAICAPHTQGWLEEPEVAMVFNPAEFGLGSDGTIKTLEGHMRETRGAVFVISTYRPEAQESEV